MNAPRPTTYVVRAPRGLSKVAKQHLRKSRALLSALLALLLLALVLTACDSPADPAALQQWIAEQRRATQASPAPLPPAPPAPPVAALPALQADLADQADPFGIGSAPGVRPQPGRSP